MIKSTTPNQYWKLNQQEGGGALSLSQMEFEELLHTCDFVADRRNGKQLQGFMLGISAGKGGDNFGYQWFMARFDSFLYIDRVVVEDKCKRLGLAIEFYHEAVHWCRARGIEHIVCQIHDRPPNPAAHALHDKLGFTGIESVMLPSRNIVTMVQRSTAIDTP